MKDINITSKTAAVKITAELEVLQHRCTARVIDLQDIYNALEKIENHIGVPKCHLNGTVVTVDVHGQDFPSAYKYTPESTVFDAVNVKGKWHILDIRREQCHRYKDRVQCTLSDEAKSYILGSFEKFSIQ